MTVKYCFFKTKNKIIARKLSLYFFCVEKSYKIGYTKIEK